MAANSTPSDAVCPSTTGALFSTWAGTHTSRPTLFYRPRSVAEVQEAVRSAARTRGAVPLRVVGAGHSPNDCAMSSGSLLSLDALARVLHIDAPARRVRVQAGIRVSALNAALDAEGLALDNLGSISDQSLAGMFSMGTHGTGCTKPALHACVLEALLVTASGELLTVSQGENADLLDAVRLSLGCLGVIAELVVSVVPAFDLHTHSAWTSLDALLASDLPARAASAELYRFHWFPHTAHVVEWRGVRSAPARRAAPRRGLRAALSAGWAWLTEVALGYHALQAALWLGTFAPALVPLITRAAVWALHSGPPAAAAGPSFAQLNMNCLFRQRVNEWALPLAALPGALRALRALTEGPHAAVHSPVEVRFGAPDGAWLSPAQGAPTLAYIGIIMYRPYGVDPPGGGAYFADFDELMAARGGRPHWAKACTLSAARLRRLYPRWQDFQTARKRLDPEGLFANEWSRRLFDGEGA